MGETRWILGDAMNRVSTRWTVLGNNNVFINVCACRDVDLSRLGKRTNPITVDLSRLGKRTNPITVDLSRLGKQTNPITVDLSRLGKRTNPITVDLSHLEK